MNKMLITIFLIFTSFYTCFAQENYINNVTILTIENELCINPAFNNFLEGDILGAVNSGMNIGFHFYLELLDSKKKVIKEHESQINVRNDIWEDQYTILGYKISKKFEDFMKFRNYLLDSLYIRINNTKKIPENKKLQLYITFSPEKISITQKKKIRQWLKNEDQDSESSLSLNLSKLISFFFSDNKSDNISIYRTEVFTKNTVRKNAGSTQ